MTRETVPARSPGQKQTSAKKNERRSGHDLRRWWDGIKSCEGPWGRIVATGMSDKDRAAVDDVVEGWDKIDREGTWFRYPEGWCVPNSGAPGGIEYKEHVREVDLPKWHV